MRLTGRGFCCDARVITDRIGLALAWHGPGRKKVTMTRRIARPDRRSSWPSVLAALASLTVLAGCAASAGGTVPGNAPVASLGSTGHGAIGSGPLTQEQSDLDMIHFTRCMRAHDVSMQDPFHRPGHAGLSIDMPPQDAITQAAYSACTHFIEPVIQMKEAGAVALSAPRLAALTRYAECMRSHDIAMLDPDSQGELNLGTVPGMNSDFGRDSPQFLSADHACRHFLPAGVHDDGTGP